MKLKKIKKLDRGDKFILRGMILMVIGNNGGEDGTYYETVSLDCGDIVMLRKNTKVLPIENLQIIAWY